ncbi:Farnesyl diphosphate synthase [Orchesella cincta]|uniref:Farnesyl pyrophosphate synthase n=1 Tax=Orchesella cincta TaxID=48709 RepID=A0A1D2M2I5_ORCCI|nr:Farnesyl diphosphate synthase [Orchesella cincta]
MSSLTDFSKKELLLEKQRFNDQITTLLTDLLTEKEVQDVPWALAWLKKVFLFNVPHGKQIRFRSSCPLAVRGLERCPTEKQIQQAYILGWCVEILQACCLVADDIMDKSDTRRGRPCWYKVDGLESLAFNDSLLLEHIVYRIINKYFKNTSFYSTITEIFLGTTYKTVLGQCVDTQTGKNQNYDGYTMEKYKAIVKYKTCYYTFHLPIALAATIAELKDTVTLKHLEQFALKLGYLFQVQDDFLDCFASENLTGKIGTDIQNGKCTWLFICAKDNCSQEELELLLDNYGYEDKHKVDIVKKLYDNLLVQEKCIGHMQDMAEDILHKVENFNCKQVNIFMQHLVETVISVPKFRGATSVSL